MFSTEVTQYKTLDKQQDLLWSYPSSQYLEHPSVSSNQKEASSPVYDVSLSLSTPLRTWTKDGEGTVVKTFVGDGDSCGGVGRGHRS